MKKTVLTLVTLVMAIYLGVAQKGPTLKFSKATIPGKWKVESCKKESGETNYAKDSILWTFGQNGVAEIEGAGLPQMNDYYDVSYMMFNRDMIIILMRELKTVAKFTWQKFVVREISEDGNTLFLGNVSDTFLYKLKRVSDKNETVEVKKDMTRKDSKYTKYKKGS
ncbi:hypothetical protein [Sediminicola luteus]|uniref:Uncharacterized protein n=1 Tax=Sediminicola luteus TaxID=319238 RepID=A0A2A4G5N2_9FLAO|nr:hypothetical protein [Sediminicola luteus]PCE63733.1 hypothetical protein B7P33_10680 [Sediminicola luteus]